MSEWAPKRFWTSVQVETDDAGFLIHLDARPVRTPAKKMLVVPTQEIADKIAESLFHFRDQLIFGKRRVRPLIARFQDYESVRDVWRHWIGSNLGGACAGEDQLDLRKLLQAGLDLSLHCERLLKWCGGDAQRLNGQIAFVELRCELASDEAKDQRCQSEHTDTGADHRPGPSESLAEQRFIAILCQTDRFHFMFTDFALTRYEMTFIYNIYMISSYNYEMIATLHYNRILIYH